jgi:hypothetical protein
MLIVLAEPILAIDLDALKVFFHVRPAGRTHSEVKVLYTADMGKC